MSRHRLRVERVMVIVVAVRVKVDSLSERSTVCHLPSVVCCLPSAVCPTLGQSEECEIDKAYTGKLREGVEHRWYYMPALEGEYREKQ